MLLRLCIRLENPFVLENPLTSMLWDVPEVQKIEASANVHARVSDLCAFGTPWKKPTKCLVGNVDFADAEGLALRCTGRGG